jgi:hypothetical protein
VVRGPWRFQHACAGRPSLSAWAAQANDDLARLEEELNSIERRHAGEIRRLRATQVRDVGATVAVAIGTTARY